MATKTLLKDKKGQSILEVVFVLPFLFLFVGLLFKLNMGLQASINNTQYARSQVYVLTANSPEYPRLEFRNFMAESFVKNKQDRIVLGVADPEALTSAVANESTMDPIPQIQKIGRNSTVKGSNESGEQSKRTDIRIRNTSAICTQLNQVPTTGSVRWPFGQAVCQYTGMEDQS